MANPEHVEWLKEGVKAWNERRQQEQFRPDLGGADLREADLWEAKLRGAELQGANLQGADLQGAKLQGAKLQSTDLREADLQRADLGGAYLQRAKLQGAYLREADLREADLREADLQRADLLLVKLERANLQGANLQGANLQRADLREANVKSLKPALRRKDAGKADFTFAENLKQSQLELMIGDTGVLLPEDLTYPDDWPVWEEDNDLGLEEESEQEEVNSDARVDLIQVLVATSPVNAVLEDGKVGIRDMPLDGKPAADDPQDLVARFKALERLCETFVVRWENDTPNISLAIKGIVSQCLKSANDGDSNWYIWEDHASEIQDRLDLDADYDWRGTDRLAARIQGRILELKQYLKPLPINPSAPDEYEQIPEIAFDESSAEKVVHVVEAVDNLLESPEIQTELTEQAQNYLENTNAGFKEGVTRADSVDPHIRETGFGIWRSNILKLAGYVASTIGVITAGVATNLLTSPAAFETLRNKLQVLLELLFGLI